jgi:sigma-B regulation protein RsbU (phosphoserine phosphatase)
MLALGDVCGKGVDAAVVSALARHTIRAAAIRDPRPSVALAALDDVLSRHESKRFCTAALVRLRCEREAWSATISIAGHPLPLLVRAGGGPEPAGLPGPLLGVLADAEFRETELPLRPGDVLLLYTDGVTEGQRGREFYGSARLLAAVERSRGTATSLVDGLLADVLSFQAGKTRDDVALLAVMVPGGDAPGSQPAASGHPSR